MSLESILVGRKVAVSVSESTNIESMGFGPEHLVDATTELARHLLALGSGLVYGGDLRAGGFTQILSELSLRHRKASNFTNHELAVENYLAWPVHVSLSIDDLEEQVRDFERCAVRLTLLSLSGETITAAERRSTKSGTASEHEWHRGLTAMRRYTNTHSFARIILGGRVDGYRGRMPGIAEEALIALELQRPLFIIGGFGGCARDVARILGFVTDEFVPDWPGCELLSRFDYSGLNNGLHESENNRLAATPHIDEAATLIIRGLLRLAGPP